MTDRQKVREAFEAHILKLNPCSRLYRHHGGAYRTVSIERAWQLWQAALAHASSATVKENLTVGSAESSERGAPEEVVCEVIGHIKDGEDGPYIDWMPEGGIHSLPPGLPIFALEGDFDIEDGWASLYTHHAPSAEDARDAMRWRKFVSMVDPDKVPGGFTVYLAMENDIDRLCYCEGDIAELVDQALAAERGEA